ncbi:MAG: ankyrin repeat domain-containing protein [Cyanobacteria bacterium]|nr:ankyrin repeat domain-containing protein [Cyanobacteriota bacterium]
MKLPALYLSKDSLGKPKSPSTGIMHAKPLQSHPNPSFLKPIQGDSFVTRPHSLLFKGNPDWERFEHLEINSQRRLSPHNMQLLKKMLEDGIDPNATDEDGLTPVHWAAKRGHLEVLDLLLSFNGNALQPDDGQNLPIHTACQAQDAPEIIDRLLKAGTPIDVPGGSNHKTPLAMAIDGQQAKLIQYLIKKGANPNKYSDEECLLSGIIRYRPSHSGNKTLPKQYLQWMKNLIDAGADPNFQEPDGGMTPLMLAAQDGQLEAAKLLIDSGASLTLKDELGRTAIHYGALGRNTVNPQVTETLQYLLKTLKSQYLDTQKPTYSPKLFLELLTDNQGQSPLHLAAKTADLKILDLFLEEGLDPNALDEDGNSPLHEAVVPSNRSENSMPPVVDCLLKAGANPHLINYEGKTALHILSKSWYANPAFNTLLALTKDMDQHDKTGRTLLHEIALAGNLYHLKLVLAKGASVTVVDHKGQTPLHLVDKGDAFKIFDTFLKHGANPHLLDLEGRSPVMKALLSSQKNFLTWLFQQKTLLEPYKAWIEKSSLVAAAAGHKTYQKGLVSSGLVPKDTPDYQHLLQWRENQAPRLQDDEGSLAFLRLTPFLMGYPFNHSLEAIFKKIEHQFDHFPGTRGYHPNEAELMLLAKHPDLHSGDRSKISTVTTALTSLTRFIDTQTPLTEVAFKAWGDIGLLTHSFRFWRYDTQGGPKSLFAKFGFKLFPTNRIHDDKYGKGFWYKDPDSKILFEFRRGYLVATHPEEGTLVIRNSSQVFGRDLLKHPAYFLPNPMSLRELETFDPQKLPEDAHILNRDLYTQGTKKDVRNDLKIAALTNGFLALKENYRRYKLDTKAFEGYGNEKHFTGHLSPGLKEMVAVLNTWKLEGKALPDLAFVHPEFPIGEGYAYGEDTNGEKVQRFLLTASHLKELTDFVSGGWTVSKYPDSNWIKFLKQAGVENRGELVMLESEESHPNVTSFF